MKTLLTIIILLIAISNGSSQAIDTLRFLNMSDSLLITNTSSALFHYLNRADVPFAAYTRIQPNVNLDWNKINDREYTKRFEITSYMTGYDINLPNKDIFLLKDDTTTDIISWGRPLINFEFDTRFNVIKQPDYVLLNKIYSRIISARIIDRDTAILKSQAYFLTKKKKIYRAIIEYDITSDLLYWRISKTRGNYILREEQILINAETGAFIKRENKREVLVIAY